MASDRNDGGSAFPGFQHFIAQREDSKGPVQVVTGQPHGGMTMRDYFAAHIVSGAQTLGASDAKDAAFARRAYQIADALLKARE